MVHTPYGAVIRPLSVPVSGETKGVVTVIFRIAALLGLSPVGESLGAASTQNLRHQLQTTSVQDQACAKDGDLHTSIQ